MSFRSISCRCAAQLVILVSVGAAARPQQALGQGRDATVQLNTREGYVPVADSVRLFYRMLGEGSDTIIVVHGGPGFHSNYLEPDLKPLAARHVLLFFDQRNAGRSTLLGDTADVNARHLVADLEALRIHFRLERLNLLGHSWGGLLAGLYAARHPDRVQRMVLVGAVGPTADAMRTFNPMSRLDSVASSDRLRNLDRYRSGPADSTKACWDYYALWARGFFTEPVQARRMWGDLCNVPSRAMTNPIRSYPQQSLGAWDIRQQLRHVGAPVLIVQGEQDPIPPAATEQWTEALPNSQLFRVPNSAHSPFVDQPASFFTAVEAFLAGGWPDSSALSARGAAVVFPGDERRSPYLALRAAAASVENELMASIGRADWDSVAGIYTHDALIFAPGVPPITGRQAIKSFWRAVAGKGMRNLELQIMDLEGHGEQLTVYGKYVMRGNEDVVLDVGKFIALYVRRDGEWRLHRDMFNSSMETRSPLEVPDYITHDR